MEVRKHLEYLVHCRQQESNLRVYLDWQYHLFWNGNNHVRSIKNNVRV
jgi:hypothetical protein